jgi:hypothetical protein
MPRRRVLNSTLPDRRRNIVPSWRSQPAAYTATATASATPHTAGSWVELSASTSEDANMLLFGVTAATFVSGTNTSTLIQIGIGPAASEVVIVDWFNGGSLNMTAPNAYPFVPLPVEIPAGSRLVCRVQSLVASKTVDVGVLTWWDDNLGFAAPKKIVSIGADTATSSGVTLGGIGVWTEIVASTTEPYRALVMSPTLNTATAATATIVTDVGIGAAAAEVVIGSATIYSNTTEIIGVAGWYRVPELVVPRFIPQGTRLSCRLATANTGRGMILLGIPYG